MRSSVFGSQRRPLPLDRAQTSRAPLQAEQNLRSPTPDTTNVHIHVHFYALRRRTLGRLLVASLVALVACSVALHHSGFASMGHEGHHGGEQGAVASMCVGMAIVAVAVEGLLLVRRSRRNGSRRRRLAVRRLRPHSIALPAGVDPRVRAGPRLHLQLCVIRR